jgi:hypothetical protein
MSVRDNNTFAVSLINTTEFLGWTAYYSPTYELLTGRGKYGIYEDPVTVDIAGEGLDFLQFRRAERKIE